MTVKKTCGAQLDTDDHDLTCDLPRGHDGPVHSDDGHAWGDATLPVPLPDEPA